MAIACTNERAAFVWRVADAPRAQVKALADGLGLPPIVAQLLINRGVHSVAEAQAFLNPAATRFSDPYSLTDMARAVERIQQAKKNGEHIRVFGDYDADGITATAIMMRALSRFACRSCSFAVPSRSDGYGLRPEGVEAAAREGVKLLITVDNGIKSHDAAETARALGVDLIVTDHHMLDETLPDAIAVINPKRDDPAAPFTHLSGAGVAFKLAAALTGEENDHDLAALGTVADLVPLVAENRALVTLGLERMRAATNHGVHALARHAGLQLAELTSESIAFQLGPRINAAARVGIGAVGLDLLLCDDARTAAGYAEQLHAANEERRRIEKRIFEDADARLRPVLSGPCRTVVLGDEAWHAGVLGIVAARILGAYGRPTALVAFDGDGVGKGSARSAPDFDLGTRLSACSELLERHGGHRAAGGFTVMRTKFAAFQQRFEEEACRFLPDDPPPRELAIDAIVNLGQVNGQLIKLTERLEPFGEGNRSPVFAAHGVQVLPGSARELRGGHLKFTASQGRQAFEAIGFNMAHFLPALLRASRPISLAFSPRLNAWRGETTIQLLVKDLQFAP